MPDFENTPGMYRKPGTGGPAFPTERRSKRHKLTYELQKYLHVLGPTPKQCLETLADLGLSDPEIARYYRIPRAVVTDLRRIWRIGA